MKRSQWTVLALLAIGIAIAALVLAPSWLHPDLTDAELRQVADPERRITLRQAQAQLQNNARATLLQGIAGLVVVAGAVATWRQVQISRHGHITDRMTKAVDQLGERSVDIRLGGLYALERVAKNSYEDRATVTTILMAYVRTHAPAPEPGEVSDPGDPALWLHLRMPDVDAALRLLGRRPDTVDDPELYLGYTDLRRARMSDGRWDGLACRHSALTGAHLRRARLTQASLDDCDLRGARLEDATLVDASLRDSRLEGAVLRGADLRGADFTGSALDGADLAGARFDSRTRWPHGFDPPA